MENSENDEQGSTTPLITVEFIGKSLFTITNTLKNSQIGNDNKHHR